MSMIKIFFSLIGKRLRKIKYRALIKEISGWIVLLMLLVAIVPELRLAVFDRVYEFLHLDRPKIIFENIDLDGMTGPIIDGCPIGYFVDTNNIQNPPVSRNQILIYLSPDHEIRFSLRNANKITAEKIAIKQVYLVVSDFSAETIYPFKMGGDCGAGETEKIYYIDKEDLKNHLQSEGKNFQIEAIRDTSNKENFDFISLSPEDNVDFYKIKIPMPVNGLLEFRVKAIAEYKNKSYEVLSPEYYIGNIDQNYFKYSL